MLNYILKLFVLVTLASAQNRKAKKRARKEEKRLSRREGPNFVTEFDPYFSGFSSFARGDFGSDGFNEEDTDDLDYDSLFNMPSGDMLSQLIALSEANQVPTS